MALVELSVVEQRYRAVLAVLRKTVATMMDAGGLSPRQAADQLGHAKVSMTQDNYFGRKVARTGAADVLEVFGEAVPRRNPGGKSGAIEDANRSAGA